MNGIYSAVKDIRPLLSAGCDIDAVIAVCAAIALERRGLVPPIADDLIAGRMTLRDIIEALPDPVKPLFQACDRNAYTACVPKLAHILSRGISREDWLKDDIVAWIYRHCANSADPNSKTRFYTYDWIVKYIIDNTLTPYWHKTGKRVEAIKLLDPSCGGGSFLLYAFDRFYDMYVQEGRVPAEDIPRSILDKNIYGVDIDSMAVRIARLNLYMKARSMNADADAPAINIICSDHDMGSLARHGIHDKLEGQLYDVVVGNPPYLNNRKMTDDLRGNIAQWYSHSKTDLYAAFIERGLELLAPEGYLGYITPDTYLYIKRFEKLRRILLDKLYIDKLVHLGNDVFANANVSVAVLIARNDAENRGLSRFYDLRRVKDKKEALYYIDDRYVYVREQRIFKSLDGERFLYNASADILKILNDVPALSPYYADVKQGLATGCNNRFVYMRWEVLPDEVGRRWIPYAKGGGYNKYLGRNDFVIDWADNGNEIKKFKGSVIRNKEYYFREGITFSLIAYDNFNARYLPPGWIFDVGGSCIFSKGIDLYYLLGFVNSKLACYFMTMLNPTVNFQVGDVCRLPLKEPDQETLNRVTEMVKAILELKKQLYKYDVLSELYQTDSISEQLSLGNTADMYGLCKAFRDKLHDYNLSVGGMADAIDEAIFDLYGISSADRRHISEQIGGRHRSVREPADDQLVARYLQTLARRIISGCSDGIATLCDVAECMHSAIYANFGSRSAGIEAQINDILGKSIETWLRDDFANDYLNNAGFDENTCRYKETKNPWEPLVWKGQSEGGYFTVFIWRYSISADTGYKVKMLLKNAIAGLEADAATAKADVEDYYEWFERHGIKLRGAPYCKSYV
ncbi:N-6 DNA methylase [Mahella sp.]|uniref:Eco57I restriction-modification methylase domain-containing protein n=1 Tax=Mahella sp. TaxID=2798721 RepID=UPI0025B87919|nr:N-6 DNA methylase [Mahella sp.]MBZ4665899.1 hypothetical protein [Mahella sp.]MDK2903370.1 hypothetical protein [Clostridiales bacterium]